MSERTVHGIPVVASVRQHDSYGTDCPFDSVRDSHIHIEHDYGDRRLNLWAYGPYRRDSDVVDEWDRRDRWAWRSVPAVPSWWDRLRGHTLEAELDRMARRLISEREHHAAAATVIDEIERTWTP